MRDYKLANLLVRPEDFLGGQEGLYWHAQGGTAAYDQDAGALRVTGTVDFTTFLNGLSVGKWRQYTPARDFALTLTAWGSTFEVFSGELDGNAKQVRVGERPLAVIGASERPQTVTLPLQSTSALVQGFVLRSLGVTYLRGGFYHTLVSEDALHPVELALATTTFRKERYITRNIRAIREQVLGSGDDISRHFHLFVVDNGRTLPADELQSEGVTVIPNANVGGSGGFARGMMAGLAWGATHVLLMDDDVHVLPESLKRTYALLTLASGRYRDAFVNGAMLNVSNPNELFEDVGVVRRSGIYDSIKPLLHVDRPEELSRNEAMSVEVPLAYGAWWYSCIPAAAIRRNGLPLPVFVRCDDVEYGVRCQPIYMTMNGICVWHEKFDGRFNAAVDCYQYNRNFLVMMASNDLDLTKAFFLRFQRFFLIYLRALNYPACELMLDGLADFLKGPEFLEHAVGEDVLKANNRKREQLVPVAELSPEDRRLAEQAPPDLRFLREQVGRPLPAKLLEELPYDYHALPDALLTDEPAAVYYYGGAYPQRRTAFHKVLVAYDATGTKCCIRRMDRVRWRALKDRYQALMQAWRDRGPKVWEAYRQAQPHLTSEAFWRRYLHMDEDAGGRR